MNLTTRGELGRAPKGRPNVSPGHRPGICNHPNKKALKGRATVELWASIGTPFQGFGPGWPRTQGAALGYLEAAPLGRQLQHHRRVGS